MTQSILLLSALLAQLATPCVIAHVRIDNCIFDGPGKEMGGTVWDNNVQVCQGGSNKFIAEKFCMKCRAGTSFCVNADGRSAQYTNGGYKATLKPNTFAKVKEDCGPVRPKSDRQGSTNNIYSCLGDNNSNCKGPNGKRGCPSNKELSNFGFNKDARWVEVTAKNHTEVYEK